jgi:hypothetical protein
MLLSLLFFIRLMKHMTSGFDKSAATSEIEEVTSSIRNFTEFNSAVSVT